MGLSLGALLACALVHHALVVQAYVKLAPGTTFFWQLQGKLKNDPAAVYIVDGFATTTATIKSLKTSGKVVICHFSFGTTDANLPDASKFPKSVQGGLVCQDEDCEDEIDDERWVDITSPVVRAAMEDRMKLARDKGCDGIEPDHVDAYDNTIDDEPLARFTLTRDDAVTYLRWLATTAHTYDLSVGLKNSRMVAGQVADVFDWALSESCNVDTDWGSRSSWELNKYECDYLNEFIASGKAAFVAEYTSDWGEIPKRKNGVQFPQALCGDNNAHGFATRVFDDDLNGRTFEPANCPKHKPASCSPWQTCIQSSVYTKYAPFAVMTRADMVGQCVRSKLAECTYQP